MLGCARVERRSGGVRKASDKVLCDFIVSAKGFTLLHPQDLTRTRSPTALDLLLQPHESSVHPLAIVRHHADTEEA
jgi:hypothetical protein